MNKQTFMIIGTVIISIGSAMVSGISALVTRRTIHKLDKIFGKIEDQSEQKITDTIVKAAVEKSAIVKIDEYVSGINSSVLNDARKQLNEEAKKAVSEQADKIRDKVTPVIEEQVKTLDVEDLKDKIVEKSLNKMDSIMEEEARHFRRAMGQQRKMLTDVYATVSQKQKDDDSIKIWLG